MLFKPDLNEKAKAAGEGVARVASGARRRTVSIAVWLLIIGGLGYIAWTYFKPTQTATRTRPDLAIPVLAATPRIEDVPVYLDGVGTVRALNNVTVRAHLSAKIKEPRAEELFENGAHGAYQGLAATAARSRDANTFIQTLE